MRVNLLEGFGDWMRQQMGVSRNNFAQLGNIILANVTMTPDGSNKPVEYKSATMFQVWSNDDGTVFKLKDISYSDKNDPDTPQFPHINSSNDAGREYTLDKNEYDKILKFQKQPAAPGGMGI